MSDTTEREVRTEVRDRRADRLVGLLARFGRVEERDQVAASLVPVDALDDESAVAAGARSYGLRRGSEDTSIDSFVPSATFVADPNDGRARTRAIYKGSGSALLYVVAVTVLLVIPGVGVPAMVRYFVDTSLVDGIHLGESRLVLALFAASASIYLLSYISYIVLGRLNQRLKVLTESRFVRHLLRLPIPTIESNEAGRLALEVGSVNRFVQLAGLTVPEAVVNLVTIVLFVVVMLIFSWQLTLLTAVLSISYAAMVQLLMRSRRSVDKTLLDSRVELERFTIQGIQAIESIKATSSEHEFRSIWAVKQRTLQAATSRVNVVGQLIAITAPMFQLLSIGLVIIGGALLVLNDSLSLGTLVAFQGLLSVLMVTMGTVVFAGSSAQEMTNRRRRADAVLDEPEDIEVSARSVVRLPEIARGDGSIEVRGLVFGYDRGRPPLIDGLDFSVARGGRIALVGASGSGKSTIAKMVTGQLVPWDGQIIFDGVPRALIPGPELASIVAYVPQEATLFEGTMYENLTMLDDSVPAVAVERAADDACILSDIVKRPGALNSRVEPGGKNMSGGQRQRMAIARALTGDPEIVVLDEATSALDPIVEHQVEKNLRSRGVTTLVIAHRLSTIRDADEIIVLDAGRVIQRGTHDELVAVPGHYRDLVNG